MAVKKWIFDLNILQKSRIPRMELVQGDTDANVFQIHLKTLERYTEVPLDLTDSYVTVTVKKADDTIVVGEAQIIDSTNGIIEYTCRGNELSYPGLVIATIEVYDTTHIKRFTTTQFKFYVVEQLDDGSGIPSTTEYTVLTDLIAQTQSVVTNENERIENENTRIANENIRQENESIRQNNEQARVTAENNRVNAESIRDANENERINNENIRQANEETRNTAEANREQAENLRQMAEQERINAENARVAAENARNEAELARKNAENIRRSNESARISEENTRILQENARVQVENERSANENIREANEAVRQNNESVRITAEGNRVQAEAIREANEAERILNENTRIANENTRQSNEAIRQNNESIRQSNEATRINNENIRQQQEQARQASMADIENRWNTLTTAQQQDAEVINARTSTVKNKTFPALTNRIEELEQDTITPVYNETITIDGGIGSIPSNAAEGQVSVVVKGLTYSNRFNWLNEHSFTLVPGDVHSIDTTDFVYENRSYKLIRNTTYHAGSERSIQIETGKFYIAYCYAKTLNSVEGQASLTTLGAIYTERFTLAGNNNWTLLASKLNPTTSTNLRYRVGGRNQIGLEILFSGMAVIEVSQEDYNSMTASQLVEKYKFITGTKSTVCASRIRSIGKNLFNYKSNYTVLGSGSGSGLIVTYVDNGIKLQATETSILISRWISFPYLLEPNTTYTLSAEVTSLAGTARISVRNSQGGAIYSASEAGNKSFNFTTDSTGKGSIYFYGKFDVTAKDENEYKNIQLEKGSQKTSYEQYQESNAYVIAKDELGNILELCSLPNGTKDEINVSEGKLIQRIGLDYSDVDNPTFTRNSVAYLSDGTQVAANQPRFEDGPFAGEKAIMIEERTTNLFPADKRLAFTSAWTSATLNGTYTVSIHGGTGKLVLSGGATGEVVAGQSLTFSVSDATVTFTPVDGTPERCQLEQKEYATSFVDGTRATETLTIPTTGVLNPQEGTVEFWYYPLETTKYQLLWYANTNSPNGFYMTLSGGGITFVVGDGTTGRAIKSPTPVIAKTWYYVVAVWRQTGIALYINGSKVRELSFTPAPIFGSNFIISHSSDAFAANMLIDDLRISSIARSDEEILAAYQSGQPLPVDEYTAYKLKFDDNLNKERATPLIYQLANPIITQLPAQTLIGYPNGTIYWEPVVKDTAIYNNGVSIADTTLPIKTLLKVIKYVPETKTAIDITSTCTISPDKLSFTSTALTNGDTVIYEYEYDQSLTTIPTLEVTANMNLKAVVNGTSKAVANLNKYVLDLNDFTIATLLNHEMRLTLLEVQ